MRKFTIFLVTLSLALAFPASRALLAQGDDAKSREAERERLQKWIEAHKKSTPAAKPSASEKQSFDLGGGVRMDFVLILPGSFTMGSEKGYPDEKPVHPVKITRPFYMGVNEVTQAQWQAVMGNNPSYFTGDSLPVENVTWDDCRKFLAGLQQKVGSGLICRLPTEAEWEYACRAGSKTEYCFGDGEQALDEFAWYNANSAWTTHPVGQKKPNAWGLYDMHGNVWERCGDWYGEGYYAKCPLEDPKGPESGAARVLRGGSWTSTARYARSASRGWNAPSLAVNNDGLRVVLSAK